MIKNWTVGRPGNEASVMVLSKTTLHNPHTFFSLYFKLNPVSLKGESGRLSSLID